MKQLERARAAIGKRDLPAALGHLLDAWRAAPAPAIAHAIDVIGERAADGMKPPTGKTVAEREAAWVRAAKSDDPVLRHVLVASLTDTKGSDATLARIEALATLPPDPRVSAKIADLVETPAYNASVSRTKAFWQGVFEILPTLGDPRIAGRAKEWPARWQANDELNEPERPALEKRLAKIAPALAALHAPALAPADSTMCAEIVAALGTRTPDSGAKSEAELLAAIYAALDDDAPRLVYSDWLQEKQDPRGEFIALQLARADGRGTPAATKREKELWAELGTRWLEAYPGVKKTGARFERGFLAVCEMTGPIDDDPIWSTVREATALPATDTARADSLRVASCNDGGFVTLASLTKPLLIEELSVTALDWDYQKHRWAAPKSVAAFGKITVLPRLRRLVLRGSDRWTGSDPRGYPHRANPALAGVSPKDLAWVWTAPCGRDLDELTFPGDIFQLAGWLSAVPTKRFTISTRGDDSLDLGWQFVFERPRLVVVAPPLPKSMWYRDHYGDEIVEAIERLPDRALDSARVAIHPTAWKATSKLRTEIKAAFADRGITATIEQATR